jgi:hypothetical protein
VRVIDLVRDPRDMLASIRSFNTRRGTYGFGRRAEQSEDDFVEEYIDRLRAVYEQMLTTPATLDRALVRYEDLATDPFAVADRLGRWLDVELDAATVVDHRNDYLHHITTDSAVASIGRWHRDLAASEADLLTRSLHEPLAAFGYR